MASFPTNLADETFLDEIINDTRVEFCISSKTEDLIEPPKVKKEPKTPDNKSRKSVAAKENIMVKTEPSDTQEKKKGSKKSENKKSMAPSRGTQRQPLETLDCLGKVLKEAGIVNISPSKILITLNSCSSPSKAQASKIVIYQDGKTTKEKDDDNQAAKPEKSKRKSQIEDLQSCVVVEPIPQVDAQPNSKTKKRMSKADKNGKAEDENVPKSDKSNATVKKRRSKTDSKTGSKEKTETNKEASTKPTSHSPKNNGLSEEAKANINPESPSSAKTTKKKTPTKAKSSPGCESCCSPSPEEMSKLENIFPNVDPLYLKSQFMFMKGSLQDTIELVLIQEKISELPTKADYLKRLEMEELENKYTENFSVENFLKIIPDPWNYFLTLEKFVCKKYANHSLYYLKNKFKKHYASTIQDTLAKNQYSLYRTNKQLQKKNRHFKMRATNRSKFECDAGRPTEVDIQFLQEVAFIENEDRIREFIKTMEASKLKKYKEAKKSGFLVKCQSCGNFNLLPDDSVQCPANHIFCKDCVAREIEREVENKNFVFKCLAKCDKEFNLDSFHDIVKPDTLATIIRKSQLEEIKAAEIEDLVYCPFCYYVTIMPQELTVLRCLNPMCMKESCRICHKVNHIPLKCDELDLNDTMIMTEDNNDKLSTCLHCKQPLTQEDNSNKLVCPCGATFCYICHQPFPDCPHFHKDYTEPEDDNPEDNELAYYEGKGFVSESGDKSPANSTASEESPTFFHPDFQQEFTQSVSDNF